MSETKLTDCLKNVIFCKEVSDNNYQTYVGDVVGEPMSCRTGYFFLAEFKSSETYNYYNSRKIRFPSIISLIVPLENRKVNAKIEIAKKISSRFKLEYIRDL